MPHKLVDLPDGMTALEKMLYVTYTDLIAFGKRFLPGDFMKTETPLFHYPLADEINGESTKPCAIILPRDSAKTTMIKASIVHDFAFHREFLEMLTKIKEFKLKDYWWNESCKRESLFYGWVAKSQDDSIDNVKYVAKHCKYNYDLTNIFGVLVGDTWNKEEIVTKHGDRLISSSNLKSLRGKTEATIESGALRFNRVFGDDLENEQNTKTVSSRKDLKDTLFASILPAIEQKSRCRLFVIGTPVHYDSIIQGFIEAYEKHSREGTLDSYPWKILMWRSTQPEMPGGVLWNSRRPRAVLDKIKNRFEVLGKLYLYYQEYELEVQTEDTAIWTRNHIQFHDSIFLHEGGNVRDGKGVNYLLINGEKKVVNTFIGCDPATDIETRDSDYSCLRVIAVDEQNRRYSLHGERHRSIPMSGLRGDNDELIGKKGVVDYYIELYDKFHCIGGSIEDVAMNRSVFQDLWQRKLKLQKMYIVANSVLPAGTNKLNRISSYLSSFFSQRMIYYRETDYNLIDETIKFGRRMAHDDDIEAFFIANYHAYPPGVHVRRKELAESETEYYIPRRKKKSWKVL